MIGSFAGVVFKVSTDEVQTFRGLTRTTRSRYANHEVIGTKPVKEYLGPGLSTMSFAMELRADLGVNPMEMIRRLDTAMASGASFPFILGGKNLGEYSILTKGEEYGIILQNGAVVSCTIDLELEEYA